MSKFKFFRGKNLSNFFGFLNILNVQICPNFGYSSFLEVKICQTFLVFLIILNVQILVIQVF